MSFGLDSLVYLQETILIFTIGLLSFQHTVS